MIKLKLIKTPKINSSLKYWLRYCSHQHHKSIDLGLDRIKKVAKKLNVLKPAKNVIIVSGTNGKGTTCHLIESILLHSKIKVGVYSSPHILSYTERVRIEGKTLNQKDFCTVFNKIESNRNNIPLTYFEYSTLAALELFKKYKVELAILEVGLGGRLDATNIIDADISIITNIDFDHQEWLGNTIKKIGKEKCGIFRSDKYAIFGDSKYSKYIKNFSKKINTKPFFYKTHWNIKKFQTYWEWKYKKFILKKLPYSKHIPIKNIATGLAAIYCLMQINNKYKKISYTSITYGLNHAKLPGRFQIISKNPSIILDVAHNPHAAYLLSQKISKLFKKKNSKVHLLIGILKDKDIKNIIKPLLKQVNVWYVASLQEERGADYSMIIKYIKNSLYYTFNSVKDAWIKIKKNVEKNDIIIVCGSFYTVSHIMKILKKRITLNDY
ncbi:MAG: bifunctional tetrahydrofolate synthase/dihydrofolate synthase [Arsenophonus sp.]|nr:MAG: bifunctional tetrahydrofolate synthase/dihydrofolate synthase [Arsenophonus sp.]